MVDEQHPERLIPLGLRTNAGPLDNVTVAFGPTLTALYGKNGAGKTWILNALRAAARGSAAGLTQLVCDFPPESNAHVWVLENLGKEPGTRFQWPEEIGETYISALELPPGSIAEFLREWPRRHQRFFWREGSEDALISELACSSRFALVPTGSVSPQWDVWLCLYNDQSINPAFYAAVQDFKSFHDRLPASRSEFLDELEAELSGMGHLSANELEAARVDKGIEWEIDAIESYMRDPVSEWVWQYSDNLGAGLAGKSLVEAFVGMLDDGLPVPVVKLFETSAIPLKLEDDEDDGDLNLATAHSLATFSNWDGRTTGRDARITRDTDRWVKKISTRANRIYHDLLQDGPELRLEVLDPHQWLTRPGLRWGVRTGRDFVPIDRLSRAERRWARVAIQRALNTDSTVSLLVVDEPEAALHRAAERHMARGLNDLAVDGPRLVVATHSPEVLNTRGSDLVHVRKSDGRSTVGQIPELSAESLDVLGLNSADLIGIYRVFLLVEGVHDVVILECLLGDILKESRVKVVAMRGGSKLPGTIESQLIFDMSDAQVVALLDNVEAQQIERVWKEALDKRRRGGESDAITHLNNSLRVALTDRKGEEYGWISNWLSRALEKGRENRMTPLGLNKLDIIEYLPVESLVPRASKSWVELRAEHDDTLNRSKNRLPFKTWLERTYQADFAVDQIRQAAEAVDHVPAEIQRIGYRLREISARRL